MYIYLIEIELYSTIVLCYVRLYHVIALHIIVIIYFEKCGSEISRDEKYRQDQQPSFRRDVIFS